MRVWIDNTSLHGGGRCITGTSASDYDVQNLLQLLSLIIFSDKIEIGGFETGEISQVTGEIIDKVEGLSVPRGLFERVDITPEQYGDACFQTAESAFDDILSGRAEFHTKVGENGFDLPVGAVHPFERLTELIETDDTAQLEDSTEASLELKAAGAIDHMIARSKKLRHSLRRLHRIGLWDEASSFHISAYLRGLLNLEIARIQRDCYFPSASRAKLLNSAGDRIVGLARTYQDALDDIHAEVPLTNKALDLPLGPIGFYLLEKARGNPSAMVQAAGELREALSPSLKLLSQIRDGLNSINHNKQKDACEARDEIVQHIRFELGMEPAPRALDSVKGRYVIGDTFMQKQSFEFFSPQEFARWLKYQYNKKRLYGLVEMASVYSRSNIDNRHLDHLKRQSKIKR